MPPIPKNHRSFELLFEILIEQSSFEVIDSGLGLVR